MHDTIADQLALVSSFEKLPKVKSRCDPFGSAAVVVPTAEQTDKRKGENTS